MYDSSLYVTFPVGFSSSRIGVTVPHLPPAYYARFLTHVTPVGTAILRSPLIGLRLVDSWLLRLLPLLRGSSTLPHRYHYGHLCCRRSCPFTVVTLAVAGSALYLRCARWDAAHARITTVRCCRSRPRLCSLYATARAQHAPFAHHNLDPTRRRTAPHGLPVVITAAAPPTPRYPYPTLTPRMPCAAFVGCHDAPARRAGRLPTMQIMPFPRYTFYATTACRRLYLDPRGLTWFVLATIACLPRMPALPRGLARLFYCEHSGLTRATTNC